MKARLFVNDSDIDKVSIHQSDITKITKKDRKDWIVETIVKHGIMIFQCCYRQK